jgi:AhpD family alkylhydroperoxidase
MARKPVFSAAGFLSEALSVAAETPALAKIYLAHSLPPTLRESVWVAVSTLNQCRQCSFVHRKWASNLQLSDQEMAALTNLDLSRLDHRQSVAFDYLLTWVQSDFRGVPPALEERFQAAFPGPQASHLRTVARLANLSNLTSNTFDALLSRIKGDPVANSRLVAELLATSVFLPVAAVVLLAIMVVEREMPLTTLERFRAVSETLAKH